VSLGYVAIIVAVLAAPLTIDCALVVKYEPDHVIPPFTEFIAELAWSTLAIIKPYGPDPVGVHRLVSEVWLTQNTVPPPMEAPTGTIELTSVKLAVLVPIALVALIVTFDIPATAGMPEITPVEVFIDNPVGKPIALKLVGLLVAVIV